MADHRGSLLEGFIRDKLGKNLKDFEIYNDLHSMRRVVFDIITYQEVSPTVQDEIECRREPGVEVRIHWSGEEIPASTDEPTVTFEATNSQLIREQTAAIEKLTEAVHQLTRAIGGGRNVWRPPYDAPE